jgi:glycosyltransferase involved in cell wall biosynthesis
VIEDLAWKYTLWYYDQMDVVYAPSRSTAEELSAKGIDPEKIRVYPRGIDVDRFRPEKRNGYYESRYSIEEPVKLLYVGRVSKEKNLHVLQKAFRQAVEALGGIHLVVVGEGPYLCDMKAAMADLPCTFTGALDGEDLCSAYASADLFVFPSATDTFGNVVLEAQASGIPVIVTDRGGPVENMVPEETGLVVPANNPGRLVDAISDLATDGDRRHRMGIAARRAMEKRSFEAAFIRTWDMYRSTDPARPMAHAK